MPVQSKILGRARKPPPAPGPKPILKQSKLLQRPNSVPGCPSASPILSRPPRPFLSPTPYSAPRKEISTIAQPFVSFRSSTSDDTTSTDGIRDGFSMHRLYSLPNGDVDSDDVFGNSLDEVNLRRHIEGQRSSIAERVPRLSAAQALSECEDHTDWVNELLSHNNLPRVLDLRKSIGDGYTLPTLLEIVSGITLYCVKLNPSTKESRIENIRKCLVFLCKHGADISGIDPTDLEDGNLKSTLSLLSSIRKHFKAPTASLINGHVDPVKCPPAAPVSPSIHRSPVTVPIPTSPTSPSRGMPGTMRLPGAVPTPFQVGQDQLQSRNNLPSSPIRKHVTYTDGEILPGMMGQNHNGDTTSKAHTSLISNTELGTTCVAQHGVEERRVHLAHSGDAPQGPSQGAGGPGRGILLRHPNAKVSRPNTERPLPTGVTRAWTASPRPQANGGAASRNGNTVEDRLRQLINSSNKNNSGAASSDPSRDNQGGDGLFHGGGSEVFNDDDLLIIPPPAPKPHASLDYDLMLGDQGYGPGYRNPSNPYNHRAYRAQGYVPSKPSDKRPGPRADTLLQTQPVATQGTNFQSSQQPPSLPGRPMGGRDYYGYSHGTQNATQHNGPSQGLTINSGHQQSSNQYTGHTQQPHGTNSNGSNVNLQNKPPSPRKGEESDLRSAWNKLYGPNSGAPRPQAQPLVRGDNLRASYGQPPNLRNIQSSRDNVKYDAGPPPAYNRPVSAPAPAHMQVHFQSQERLKSQFNSQDHLDNGDQGQSHTTSQRESPMGQSSSTQGQLEDSSSSQQSGPQSRQQMSNSNTNLFSSSVSKIDSTSYGQDRSSNPTSPSHSNFAIGPSSKYPENNSRPSSARRPPTQAVVASPSLGRAVNKLRSTNDESMVDPSLDHNSNQNKQSLSSYFASALQQNSSKGHHSRGVSFEKTMPVHRSSEKLTDRSYDPSHDRSRDRSHDVSHDLQDESIFDYVESRSETSGSMTPPLPPLSPTNTPPESPVSDRSFELTRSYSATNLRSSQPMHERPIESSEQPRDWHQSNHILQGASRLDRRPPHKKHRHKRRSKGLSNVDEINTETESNLSFDIDDTILTIDSHDTEQPHPAGDLLTSRETTVLRKQLRDLESKYTNLAHQVDPDPHQPQGPRPIGRPRRWSIASSDTSSFRREAKYKPGKQIIHKHQSKEFKNINKRFQRLESHVVTLARSVAHLSSELRTHNTIVNDVEGIKKDLEAIRSGQTGLVPSWPPVLGSRMTEYERFRGWVPSLTNPKRVNKLTKFFGSEPPLLELFLKKLGYEKYVSNFKSEHIGMIELPYMTEERLEKIGVPMGPRLRILQEAQQCFRHENFNIYLV